MPVQDAINLAEYLVDVTKKYFAFLPGADIVAGDTDIATVTKHEGFKWIRRKHYYSPQFNRGKQIMRPNKDDQERLFLWNISAKPSCLRTNIRNLKMVSE